MDEPVAVALKFGFLAVLYLFLLWVSRSALRDLRRGGEASVAAAEPGDAPGSQRLRDAPPQPGLMDGMEPRLQVIAALGHEPGVEFDIPNGALLGRAESAEIKIDDPYASNAHARVFSRGDFMHVEDMGSTTEPI